MNPKHSDTPSTEWKHPAFVRAESLKEPWRSHFSKTVEEAQNWKPMVLHRALSSQVLVVARTRIECAWAAYVDAVPGMDHTLEVTKVLESGSKLDERLARVLFPSLKDVPYAG